MIIKARLFTEQILERIMQSKYLCKETIQFASIVAPRIEKLYIILHNYISQMANIIMEVLFMNNTKEKLKVPELVDKAEALLKERGYKDSLLLYRRYWNRFISFCETKNYLYFTENIGNEFLEEQKLTPTHYHTLPKGSTLKMIIRSIRILGDYQLHGTILRITKPSKAIPSLMRRKAVSTSLKNTVSIVICRLKL